MIQFITSCFINEQTIDPSNHFIENISRYWTKPVHFLHFASDPENPAMADQVSEEMRHAFTEAGLPIAEICTFDGRCVRAYAASHSLPAEDGKGELAEEAATGALAEAIAWADVFYLAGGHCPTEHAFLEKCKAREALQNFDGIFLGLSAGSMNAAKKVYLAPELPGEADDPNFVRFATGLGLTDLQIVPHWQYLKNQNVDGKPYPSGILAEDSYGRPLYLLNDGSYFVVKDGAVELFGQAEVMENGCIRPLDPGMIYSEFPLFRELPHSEKGAVNRLLDRVLMGNYDLMFTVEEAEKEMQFLYVSPYYQNKGYGKLYFSHYQDFIEHYIKSMVVPEEQEAVRADLGYAHLLTAIRKDGEFVCTVHVDTEAGIQAQKLTMRLLEDFLPGKSKILMTFVNIASVVDHDWMTDIYSRSGFLREADRILPIVLKDRKVAIVYTNILGFKAINDIFGMNGGDMVIFQERDTLQRTLDPLLIAHYDADHFVLLTDLANLSTDNLTSLSKQSYTDGYKQYQFGIHFGIFLVSDLAQGVNYMIDRARMAEESIPGNLGQVFAVYDDDMGSHYIEQKTYASQLDHALEKGEIKTFFQPVVDAKTHEIISAEALVRWQHPDKGMISPGCFVPAFEENGQISKVDYRMLCNVLTFNQKRKEQGLPMIPCAVNLSRVDFYDISLINNINKLLQEYQDLPSMLKFEVTESAFMDLEATAVRFLSEIRGMGMSVLLDDYGSGMSSIATLESFDFDILKLDMSFTRKIGKSKKAEAIIRSTIEMAHGVGAKVVAEGVETEEQLAFLNACGCDYIQGYYFYKPLPEDEFTKVLLGRNGGE